MTKSRRRSYSESDHYDGLFENPFEFPILGDDEEYDTEERNCLRLCDEENKNSDLQLWPLVAKIDDVYGYGSSLPLYIETNDSNHSNRSSFSSGSWTDDSVELSYSPLEEKHFEDAINKGAFSEASVINRRERKKSFNQICKRLSFDNRRNEMSLSPRHQQTELNIADSSSGQDLPSYMQRTCSLTEVTKLNKSPLHKEADRRRKNSTNKNSNKILKKLSSTGIPLDIPMNITLDEVHDMQQKFYTSGSSIQQVYETNELKKYKVRPRSSSIM